MKHIIDGNLDLLDPQVNFLSIGEEAAGQRLDNFLVRVLKGVPKTHVYRIIRSGEVRVNKGRASAHTRVQVGDVVRVPPVRLSERAAQKSHTMANQSGPQITKNSFPILFEDEHFLAIDKPAGLAVHGGSGVDFGVIEQLRMRRPEAPFLELVHRLDRETSGILLVAKKRSALKRLQDQFRERITGKTYLALVLGQWPLHKKVLNKPLHKYLLSGADNVPGSGERRVKVVAKDDPNGMPSVSLVKVRARASVKTASKPWSFAPEGCSLLEVTIKTGRTHQIRVHLASEGLPIMGDDKYGNFAMNKAATHAELGVPLRRMFLHAWRLQCNHPATGERLELVASLPPDLENFLVQLVPNAVQILNHESEDCVKEKGASV